MNDFPVYVLSKGRAGFASTCEMLEGIIPYTLLTLPEEEATYRKHYPHATILAKQRTGMTIGEVRNCIIDHARTQGHRWIWMIDDDIEALCDSRNRKQPVTMLHDMEPLIKQSPASMVGLEYATYAWAKRDRAERFELNCVLAGIYAINVEATKPIRYSPLRLWEDVDFIAQLLTNGHTTMKLLDFCWRVNDPPGGLKDIYKQGTEQATVDICKKWPGVVLAQQDKNGKISPKLNNRLFKMARTS